jgi:hypothetical protein
VRQGQAKLTLFHRDRECVYTIHVRHEYAVYIGMWGVLQYLLQTSVGSLPILGRSVVNLDDVYEPLSPPPRLCVQNTEITIYVNCPKTTTKTKKTHAQKWTSPGR